MNSVVLRHTPELQGTLNGSYVLSHLELDEMYCGDARHNLQLACAPNLIVRAPVQTIPT